MNISDYIQKDLILFPSSGNKKQILFEMADKAGSLRKLSDPKAFKDALEAREALMSTGIGLGVAVPHAKIAGIPDFFIVIARLGKPVDWDSIDKKPVNLVFMIGGPDNRQTDYLKILSKIVLQIKNEDRRSGLLMAAGAEEIAAMFENL